MPVKKIRKKKKKQRKSLWSFFFVFLGVEIFTRLFRRKHRFPIEDNFADFIAAEKREFGRFRSGGEGSLDFCRRSENIFQRFFLPCPSNSFHPHIFRRRSLVIMLSFLVLAKVFLSLSLYLSWTGGAKLAGDDMSEMLALLNQERQAEGLVPLKSSNLLSGAANAKANDMAAQSYFAHYGPDGKKPWDWVDRGSYPYLYVGENLAMNFSSMQSAHKALMASPSHRKNIMDPRFREFGLAVREAEINGEKSRILVQIFSVRKQVAEVVTPVVSKIEKKSEQKVYTSTVASKDKPKLAITKKETIPKNTQTALRPSLSMVASAQPASETVQAQAMPTTEEIQSGLSQAAQENLNEPPLENLLISAQLEPSRVDLSTAGTSVYGLWVGRTLDYFSYALFFLLNLAILLNLYYRIHIRHRRPIWEGVLAVVMIFAFIYSGINPEWQWWSEIFII